MEEVKEDDEAQEISQPGRRNRVPLQEEHAFIDYDSEEDY